MFGIKRAFFYENNSHEKKILACFFLFFFHAIRSPVGGFASSFSRKMKIPMPGSFIFCAEKCSIRSFFVYICPTIRSFFVKTGKRAWKQLPWMAAIRLFRDGERRSIGSTVVFGARQTENEKKTVHLQFKYK